MGRLTLHWNPSDLRDPGPCIDVHVTNSQETIDAGRSLGFEYPEPPRLRALLDTGASMSVISTTYAHNWKLFQTNADVEVRALGAIHRCGEHAASVRFPGSDLHPFDPVRILSASFVQERNYACLIGRDILRNWSITFDGQSKQVIIQD